MDMKFCGLPELIIPSAGLTPNTRKSTHKNHASDVQRFYFLPHSTSSGTGTGNLAKSGNWSNSFSVSLTATGNITG